MTNKEALNQISELQTKGLEVQGQLIELVRQLSDKVEKLEAIVQVIVEVNGLKTYQA